MQAASGCAESGQELRTHFRFATSASMAKSAARASAAMRPSIRSAMVSLQAITSSSSFWMASSASALRVARFSGSTVSLCWISSCSSNFLHASNAGHPSGLFLHAAVIHSVSRLDLQLLFNFLHTSNARHPSGLFLHAAVIHSVSLLDLQLLFQLPACIKCSSFGSLRVPFDMLL